MDLKAEIKVPLLDHREHRAPRGIALGIARQLARDTTRAVNEHSRFAATHRAHAIAERIDRKAQNVKADGDVADGGGSERGHTSRRIITQRRAPR